MAKGRELKGRIKSVENTRKITKTMEMVATSKMKRAQDRVVAARPYANALADVISGLYSPDLADRFPLLRQPSGKAKKAAAIVMTGNRGLAGAFNSNILKETRNLLAKLDGDGTQVEVHAIGKKGLGWFRYMNRPVATSRSPRASVRCVSGSRSEPNWANASRSRYWESSSFRRPATLRIGVTCALPPTLETEIPTLIAGRTPL